MILAVAAAVAYGCGPKIFPGPKGPPPDERAAAPALSSSTSAPPAAPEAGPAILGSEPSPEAGAPLAVVPPPPPPPGPNAALDPAIEEGLRTAGDKHARGMRPEGPPVAGEINGEDHLAAIVTLEPGRCYTVVSFSPRGSVSSVKMRLLTPPLYTVAAAEGAVIGKGKGLCPVIPLALPYKLDISARKGAGKVGAQVFSKAK